MHKSQREELNRNNFNNKVANRGRLWVFAGVLMMTTWQGNQMLVHADETKADSTSNDASSVTSNASQLSAKAVTLSSSAKNNAASSAASTTSSAASGTSTSSTSAATVGSTSATSTVAGSSSEKIQSSSTTATSTSASAGKTSQAGRTAGVLSADTQKSSAAAVNTATAAPVSSGSEAAQTNDQQAQTSQSATGNQTVTTAVAAIDSTVDGTTNTELVNEMVSQNSPVMAGKMMTTMAMASSDQQVTNKRAALLRAAVAAADIDAGTDWNIDSNGVLHLNTGVLTANTASSLNTAWTPNAAKITAISIDSPVTAGTSTANLFKNLNQVTTINGLTNLDTSQSTNFADMFFGMTNLSSLDLSSFKTSNVTNLGNMFLGDSSLTSLNVSGWDTSKVTNMSRTFNTCQKLTNLDLSSWDTSAVTTVESMFFADSGLTSLDLSNWDVSQVTGLTNIFAGDTALAMLNVSGWQLNSKITSLNNLFAGLKSLTELDADNFSASAATTVDNLFNGDVALTTLKANNWNLSSVTSLNSLFMGLKSLTELDADNFSASAATTVNDLFNGDVALTTLNANNWNLSSVMSLASLWQSLPALTTVKAANWQVGQVATAFQILYNDPKLTTVDLSNWQTDSLTTIRGAFNQDTSLTSVNLANWETSKVTDMGYLFHDDSALTDLTLTNWKTGSLSTADDMFMNTSGLTAVDVSNWDTSRLENAAYMFGNMTNLTDLDTSKWKLDQLTDASDMFYEDTKLATLDTSGWGLSNLQNAHAMFKNVTNLTDLDTSKWKLDQLTDASYMFLGDAKLATLDTSRWGLSHLQNADNMFSNMTNLTDLDTSKWKLDQLTDANDMFFGDAKLATLDTSNWGLSNLQNAFAMFNGDQALVTLDTSHWNLSNVTQSHFMFANDVSLTNLDRSQWGLGKDTNTKEMFAGDVALTTLGQTNWDLNQVTDASYMFKDDPLLANLDTSNWGLQSLTNATQMFAFDAALTLLDTTNWNLARLETAYAMFYGNTSLTSLVADNWNMSSVTDVSHMFQGDTALTTIGNTSNWNLANVTTGSAMFWQDAKLASLDTTNWNLGKLTDADWMFSGMSQLASLNTQDWAINGPINVTNMFADDTSLKALDLAKWDLSSATAITDMLLDTPTLQELKLGSKVAFLTSDQSAVLGDAPLNDTYTGKWINTTGQTFTAAELMQLYNDTSTAVADTYVWQIDQTNVTVHDSVVDQSGQNTWSAADNFDSATDANRLSVAVTDSTVTGQVDTTIPGTYQVTYSILNAAGNVVKAIATVKVVASQVSVAAHDTTVMQGQAWQAADTFDSATDFEGQPVDFSQVTVTGADQVKTKTPGTYDVTYRYADSQGNVATKIIMVTVTPSQVAVTAKNMTVMQGQTWQAADAFVNASDATGQSVALSAVKVTGAVDTQTPGQYQVIYSYTDAYGNQANQLATITVEKSAVAIAANDVTVMQGQPWTPAESFVSATDANGDPVDLSAVTVTGADTVDTQTSGRYSVTYSYTDKYGNQASKVVTVVVKKSAVAIEANGMTIMQNQSWTPADAFVSANDANGQPVAFSQVTVVGADRVATQTPGNYELTYRYTDAYGNTASKTVMLTVKASQVAVVANDATLMQGQSWTAADSFVSATDAQGQLVQLNKVVVSGEEQVTTTVPGVYRVTYRNTDVYGNVATKTITVTVKASQVAIDAKNVTLTQGQAWTPVDSFVSAQAADGQALDFKQVSVLGANQVNVKVPGTYAVTYRVTDSYGNSVQKTILVTVKASQLGLTVKNMTVKQGTAWTAADALVSATDATGQSVGVTQLNVTGAVDTSKVGSYPVRYQNTDVYSNQIERTAMITVTPTSLNHSVSKPNKPKPIVEPGRAAVVKPAKAPTQSSQSISTRTNAKQKSVETVQAAVVAKAGTTKQPTGKLRETHSKAPAKATKATSLPQTDESSANGAVALGALMISFTGLLSFFNKKRRN